jgi:two-component system chemotaxis sensor kinase CheA
MDIVGELLVVKNALPYIASNMQQNNIEESKRELSSKYDEISRIIEQLRDRVMQMRLLPLEYIFGRYPKLVRDISKKLNKKIKYIEEGGETKLDKMVIEKLADPLVHIIRNSLDHGIEIPEERVAKGKSPEGILKISANSQGDKVFITIKDDGRGIDIDKVVTKALEKRLISVEMLDNMSEEEKLRLIFLPGLSTKDEITELSGRGVGTDAVKKTIEELGGRIYIKSLKGTGTEIKLELPLSVALTNVFHIKMANINYAIPMDFIVETVKVLDKEIQTANHKPFIKIRGELIPLLIEKELLGYEKLKGEVSVVIIKSNDEKIGFVVDTFVGQLDVVQKPLTGVISYHPFITGISLLGNGEILFILDIGKILTQ